MATSKAHKEAEQRRISQIGDFKKRLGGVQELPSGLVVRIFNPGGLQVFLADGNIPNSLMTIVKQAIDKGKTPDVKDFLSEEGDISAEMLEGMEAMLNNVAVKVIVEPKILPKPENPEDRLDTQLYADEIPQDDKMFLLQWVSGGTRDLEEFRKKLDENVGVVAKSSNAVRDAQLTAGLDPR